MLNQSTYPCHVNSLTSTMYWSNPQRMLLGRKYDQGCKSSQETLGVVMESFFVKMEDVGDIG